MVVGAKGSPELSSECIPDVNWVLPAAAGHTENNKDTEALLLSKEGWETNGPALSAHTWRAHQAFLLPESLGSP